MMLRSLRARLTVWYTGVLAIVLIAFSGISYILLARAIRAATDASIADVAHEFTASMERNPATALRGDLHLDFHGSDRALLLYDAANVPVASSHVMFSTAEQRRIAAAVRSGISGFTTVEGGPEGDGIRTYLVRIRHLGQPLTIAVAHDLDEQADRLESARGAVFLGIPLALLLAAGGGYLLARQALAPVGAMSRKARQIGADTLAERIPVGHESDELGHLATTINDLLERLERAFASQRRFMADASHELRTPVAIIQGEADVTLSRAGRGADELRESIVVMQRAASKLTRIVQNLFLLARTDAGEYPMQRTRFYLDDLIAECVRSLRNIAAARGVRLEQDGQTDLMIVADEELVMRMLLNVVENALKFTAAGGTVSVTAAGEEGAFVIRVTDTGPGIPEADRERIFDRFFRAAGNNAGAGLGLPIARWIAKAHGGSVELERSTGEGSTFRIALPRPEQKSS